MARITVEDCLKYINNRFELVMVAAKRARQLERGSDDPKVAWENDKPTVVALREIADNKIDLNTLDDYEPVAGAPTKTSATQPAGEVGEVI